jgi:hypothetical protein
LALAARAHVEDGTMKAAAKTAKLSGAVAALLNRLEPNEPQKIRDSDRDFREGSGD